MKVVVDLTLCEGNARCQEVAPLIFRVEEDERARVLVRNPTEASQREDARKAARLCPRQAIAVDDD